MLNRKRQHSQMPGPFYRFDYGSLMKLTVACEPARQDAAVFTQKVTEHLGPFEVDHVLLVLAKSTGAFDVDSFGSFFVFFFIKFSAHRFSKLRINN